MQDPKDGRKDQDRWPTKDRDWDSDRRSNDDGRKIQESTDYFKPPRPKDDE